MVSTGCAATTKAGQPCRAFPVGGSLYCFAHDPGLAGARQEARARGGRARHGRRLHPDGDQPVALGTLADVCAVLGQEINRVLNLEMSIARARCIGYLASTLATIYQAGELERRIARLEARA